MRVPETFLKAGEIYGITVKDARPNGLIVLIDGTQYTAYIHISMLSTKYITDATQFAHAGDKMKAKAVQWNDKVELSIKDAENPDLPDEQKKAEPRVQPKQHKQNNQDNAERPHRPASRQKKAKPELSDLDKMIAACESSYADKMSGRGKSNGSSYMRRRSPKRKNNYNGD